MTKIFENTLINLGSSSDSIMKINLIQRKISFKSYTEISTFIDNKNICNHLKMIVQFLLVVRNFHLC